MVPLGVSMAAAVRVGRAVGRGDSHGIRESATASLLVGGLFTYYVVQGWQEKRYWRQRLLESG